MNKTIFPVGFGGEISAIPSKSVAHRLLICAALGDAPTQITCPQTSRDIEATTECLRALGAAIEYKDGCYFVRPIATPVENAVLPCGESGSTLRFLVPTVCALGVNATFKMEGRLPDRPLSPLQEELEHHGIVFQKKNNLLHISGKLTGHDFTIPANVSSQFVSGLLFMLTRHGGTLTLTEKTESAAYIAMTVQALKKFGADLTKTDNTFTVKAKTLHTPKYLQTEGDWSNAAFFLCAGAVGTQSVSVTGLDPNSAQGDKEIIEILRRFGAEIAIRDDKCTVIPSPLHGIEIDAAQIPDLVPVLAVVACKARGQTRIYNAARLRLKESDRLATTANMLNTLGADVKIDGDSLVINGKTALQGGTVDSANDHRIAMAAAVATLLCKTAVTVQNAQAVEKSYPAFWEDYEKMLKV